MGFTIFYCARMDYNANLKEVDDVFSLTKRQLIDKKNQTLHLAKKLS